MENKTVYIETSIISYLTAHPTNDLLAAAWQKITNDWWALKAAGSVFTPPALLPKRLEEEIRMLQHGG